MYNEPCQKKSKSLEKSFNFENNFNYRDMLIGEKILTSNPVNPIKDFNQIESRKELWKNQTNESQVIEIAKKVPNLRIDVDKVLSKINSNQFIIKSYNAPKLAHWYVGELEALLKFNHTDFKSDSAVNLKFLSSDSISIETSGNKIWILEHLDQEFKPLIELEKAGLIHIEVKSKKNYFKSHHTFLELKVFLKPDFFKKSEETYSLKNKILLKMEYFESQVTLPRNLITVMKLKMLKKLGLKFDESSLFEIEDLIEANNGLEMASTPIKRSSLKESIYNYRSLNKASIEISKVSCPQIKDNQISLLNYQIESLNFMLRAEGKVIGGKTENERIFPRLVTKEGNNVYFNFLDDTFGCKKSSFVLKGGILANSEELDSYGVILSLFLGNKNDFSEPEASFSKIFIKTEEDTNKPNKKTHKNKRNPTNILELEIESKTEEKFSCTSLIISSKSGLEDWRQNLQNYSIFHDNRVFFYCKTKISISNLYEKDLVLISYEEILQELSKADSKFSRHPFWRIILDQAHYIKSIPTSDFEKLVELRGNFRWCITPYPIKSDETELAFYFKFLRMRYLSNPSFLKKLNRVKNSRNNFEDLMQNFMLRLTPCPHGIIPISKPKLIYKETWVKLSDDAMALYELIDKKPELFIPVLFARSTIDAHEPDKLKSLMLRKFCNSPLNIFNENSFAELETAKEKLISNLELLNNQNIDKLYVRKLLEQIRDENYDDCTACMRKPHSVYVFNCGHYLCSICYDKWPRCPYKCSNREHLSTCIYNRPYYKYTLENNFKLAKDGYTKINQIVSYVEELILIPDSKIKVFSSCMQTLKFIETKLWEQQVTSDFFHSGSTPRSESNNKVELCIMNNNPLFDNQISHIVFVDLYGEAFVSFNKKLLNFLVQNLRSVIIRSFICSGTIEEKLYLQIKEKYELTCN